MERWEPALVSLPCQQVHCSPWSRTAEPWDVIPRQQLPPTWVEDKGQKQLYITSLAIITQLHNPWWLSKNIFLSTKWGPTAHSSFSSVLCWYCIFPPIDTEITNYVFWLAAGNSIQQVQMNVSSLCLWQFILLLASLGGISSFISEPQPSLHTSIATLAFLSSTNSLLIRICLFQLFVHFINTSTWII